MRVLVIGGGGREHALAWKLRQSPLCDALWCAPGNAGIAEVAECVPIAADDVKGLVRFAQQAAIDLTVVGPELPLTMGLVDRFAAAGLRAFGPTAAAARLEGSKAFSKELLRHERIPTAFFGVFSSMRTAPRAGRPSRSWSWATNRSRSVATRSALTSRPSSRFDSQPWSSGRNPGMDSIT